MGRGRRIDRERRQNCGGCRQNTIDLVGRSAGRACDVHAQDRLFTFDEGQRIVPAKDHADRRSTQRKLRTEELDGLRKLDTVNFQRPHVAPFPLYGGCRLLRCCMQLHLPEQAPDCVKRRFFVLLLTSRHMSVFESSEVSSLPADLSGHSNDREHPIRKGAIRFHRTPYAPMPGPDMFLAFTSL